MEYEELDIDDYRDRIPLSGQVVSEVNEAIDSVREATSAIVSANPSLKRKRKEEEAIRIEQTKTGLVIGRTVFGDLAFELLNKYGSGEGISHGIGHRGTADRGRGLRGRRIWRRGISLLRFRQQRLRVS
jgi:hypothetical protein